MEQIYRSSQHHRLFLIAIITILQCILAPVLASNASDCCANIDSDGTRWHRYNAIELNAGAIDLLSTVVEGNRFDSTTAIRQSNITCIQKPLQSLLAANALKSMVALSTTPPTITLDQTNQPHQNPHTNATNSNEYLLFCGDASISAVNDYIQSDTMRNGLSPGVQQQAIQNPSASNFIAIALNNVRTNSQRIRHRSQYDGNHYRNVLGKRMTIIDNATAYLSWMNSELDSDAFIQWLNQQRDNNKQHEFVHLVYLDVSQNQIANLTWDMFAATPNLQVLNASHNAIDGILNLSNEWFQRLTQVKHLVLSNNRLKSIAHMRLHTHWTELDENIDGATETMTTANESIDYNNETIPRLLALDLSNNQINDLQPNAFEVSGLPKLKYLNLANNQLSIIPFQVFQALEELEQLDVSNNRLVTFLDNFFIKNVALKSLNLRNNSIELIPKHSLFGLNQAIELDLSNNLIKSIDRNAFDSLNALQTLNLCENQLTALPTTLFYRLHQLKRINLSKNQFKVLPNGIFANQYNLERIHIDDTAIETFGNWISRQPNDVNKNVLKQLRHVSIRNNRQLREIDAMTFRNLPAATHLDLSGNNLINLPMEIGELNELNYLDISNNDLISVPKQLSTLPHLETINLLGNNYACDCQMVWLVQWIIDSRKNVLANRTIAKAPLNQLKYLRCRQGYPGDFHRVLEQQQCHSPTAIHVSESKTYLLRGDAQLECSFSGNPIPDVIWVTPLNKIIRYYADPDAKPINFNESMPHNNSHHANRIHADLEHQAKNREKLEYQIFKQKQIQFTAAIEANGVTLLENGTLRVHNISRKDSGLYICYGYNVMGTTRSDIR